jgi:hypothetical protein
MRMAVNTTLKSEKGQILIFITLAFILLGILAGLAVDAGRAYLIQARLSKIVDAAAIAGARAMPGATSLSAAITAATAAACDSAEINGIAATECGASGPKVFVTVDEVTNPDGSTQQGVIVNAVDPMATSFMKLGTLIGCGAVCSNITVAAAGQAAPDTLMDIVLVMDDTSSMDDGCTTSNQTDPGCPIKQARDGAEALVDCILGTACGLTSSNAKISLVPFRGCYGSSPCVSLSEAIDLTNNSGVIIGTRGSSDGTTDNGNGIEGLWAQGGSNTNVCLGINEGRKKLFGTGGRAIATKVMIVLTDADNTQGNPGLADCTGSVPLGVDIKTNNKATDVKKGLNVGSSGQNPDQTVEVFVVGYGVENPPNSSACNPSLIGVSINDRNLAKCVASNTVMGDAGAAGPNDHYFEASTPGQINAQFLAIAQELLRKLRLVN